MNIVLLGPPGAGKGTQAKRLSSVLHLPHISSGDLFRAMRNEDTALAREVSGFMDRGEYVPDQLTIEVVWARLAEPDAAPGFLLDGFPRTRVQAEALDRALWVRAQKVDVALYITAPTEVLVGRISGRIICPQCSAIYNMATNSPRRDMICDVCGHGLLRRSDESPKVARVRLETYVRQTEPLVAHYRRLGVLAEINGAEPMDDVERKVDAVVGLRGVTCKGPGGPK